MITLNTNPGAVEVSERDMLELRALATSPGWELLLRVIAAMEAGAREELEVTEQDLCAVRYLQGRLGMSKDLRRLLEEGVNNWFAAMRETPDE